MVYDVMTDCHDRHLRKIIGVGALVRAKLCVLHAAFAALFALCVKTAGEGAKRFEPDLLGALCWLDTDGVQMVFDRGADRFQRGPQHFASLVESGGDDSVQRGRVRREPGCGQGGQMHNGGIDFGGRAERGRR